MASDGFPLAFHGWPLNCLPHQVRLASEALHVALARDDEEALALCMPHALPLRPYISLISPGLIETAEQRMHVLATARATRALETALAHAEEIGAESVPEGAWAALETALRLAERVGLQGLLVRKAAAKLKEMTEAEEAARREAEALEYLRQAEATKREQAERRRQVTSSDGLLMDS